MKMVLAHEGIVMYVVPESGVILHLRPYYSPHIGRITPLSLIASRLIAQYAFYTTGCH